MVYPVRKVGSYSMISLHGEIDLGCSPEARQVILDQLESGQHVLVEMASVSYIDSSGVASLVEGLRLARTRGLEFALVAVSAPALQVLELARLQKVFAIHPTADGLLPPEPS